MRDICISQEWEPRSSWKYSHLIRMATRRAKGNSNGNELNLARVSLCFPFATEMGPVASQNLWPSLHTNILCWHIKTPYPSQCPHISETKLQVILWPNLMHRPKDSARLPAERRAYCSETQDLNGLKAEPSMEKEPMDGNGYRGPEFFNRNGNVIMLKMK